VQYSEVVVLQFLMPSSCPSIELLGGFPVGEVLVIGLDDEWLFGPNEVRSPVF
jgi:hypothetical protein